MRRIILVLAATLICAPIAAASPVFFDDFEGYPDHAAMSAAGAWGDIQDAGQAPAGLLYAAFGNPGQSMGHDGGETNRHSIAPLMSGMGAIIWEFDFISFDFFSNNQRITGGLRVDNGIPILEMGIHNNNDNPENPASNVAGYAVRTVGVGGPTDDNGWIAFPDNPAVRDGWHHFRATIEPTSILFELDFGNDGSVDATRLVNTSDTSAIGWNALRIGGPSDVSSTGLGGNFDNYSISQSSTVTPVPEPATLALTAMGLGTLGLRRRRRLPERAIRLSRA